MDNYIVSARKYRPETFETVIGQPSITTTLKNAIKSSHLAHAYLFCGPRGVGKTTCARIFAKTINCFNITDDTEACNECESCLSFNSSRSFNIHELDAASNNSVDDIRNLIEQVRIPPQVAKYSIYIIDEVHMLSSNAFNAFLKTLEEPPAHAIFILATTEKHKILPTILSRCQIFDFNRIKIEDIVSHLKGIAGSESIETEDEGLNVIAQKADGAMRDALSIFDQIASFSSGKITYQDVIQNLNVLDYDYYFRLTDDVLSGNIPGALMIFNEVLEKGFDGHNFINGMSSHLRDLLVCRDEITLDLLEVGPAIKDKYKDQSKRCSPDFLFSALSVTNQCDLNFRISKNQRLHVELCLVQLCGLMTTEKKKSDPAVNGQKEPSQDSPAKAGGETSSATTAITDPAIVPAAKPAQHDTTANSGQKEPSEPENLVPSTGSAVPNQKQAETGETLSPETGEVIRAESSEDIKSETGEVISLKTPSQNEKGISGNNSSTWSIKDVMKGTQPAPQFEPEDEISEPEEENEDETENIEADDFTEKDLIGQWKKFANQIRNKHPRLYNTLLANKPSINSQTSIEYEINNPLQEEALNKIKPELLRHLKRELNKNIELTVIINETEKGSRLYLPEDKYEQMVKKNPDLALFRQKFNLDFE